MKRRPVLWTGQDEHTLALRAFLMMAVPFAAEVPYLYRWKPATVIVCNR